MMPHQYTSPCLTPNLNGFLIFSGSQGKNTSKTGQISFGFKVFVSVGPAVEDCINGKGFLIYNLAMTCDFQQCGILTSVDSDEPWQPPFKLRNSK